MDDVRVNATVETPLEVRGTLTRLHRGNPAGGARH
eukprot:gene24279-44986_t